MSNFIIDLRKRDGLHSIRLFIASLPSDSEVTI